MIAVDIDGSQPEILQSNPFFVFAHREIPETQHLRRTSIVQISIWDFALPLSQLRGCRHYYFDK
jgi:hypothetical protein